MQAAKPVLKLFSYDVVSGEFWGFLWKLHVNNISMSKSFASTHWCDLSKRHSRFSVHITDATLALVNLPDVGVKNPNHAPCSSPQQVSHTVWWATAKLDIDYDVTVIQAEITVQFYMTILELSRIGQ